MIDKKFLEKIYRQYNKRRLVNPDPLQFLYEFDGVEDREIVGLLASSLAYGRVAQILKSVSNALSRMGPPRAFIENSSPKKIAAAFEGFRHRFTSGEDMSALLCAAKKAIAEHRSIGRAFASCTSPADENVLSAMSRFVSMMNDRAGRKLSGLLASPCDGSACKRLNLYLRWMVRRDEVDPGGWDFISPSKLVVPMDTHMHDIARRFNFTSRRQADAKTSIETTHAFRVFSPEDPVKYDFALTRFGIRSDMDKSAILGTFPMPLTN